MRPYDIVTVARCPGRELIIKSCGPDWLLVIDSEDDPDEKDNYFKVYLKEILTHRPGGYELFLSEGDEANAKACISQLSRHGVADRSIVEKLLQAVRDKRVTEDVLSQHSRWCQSDNSYLNAVPPARDAARAMYGFVPERLIEKSTDRRVDNYNRLITEYRRLLAGRRPTSGV